MSYSYDKFLRPITTSDRNIKILDDTNDIKYTIDPFVIINVSVVNNILRISLRSLKIILLNFSTKNEAKIALSRLQQQIDTLTNNVPILIDKDIQNYVQNIFEHITTGPTGPTGSSGDKYTGTSSTEFVIPLVGQVIEIQTQPNLAFYAPQIVVIYNDLPSLYGYNYEEDGDYLIAQIDNYDLQSGNMSLVVVQTYGSGTHSSWSINLSGLNGEQGPVGPQGIQGPTGPPDLNVVHLTGDETIDGNKTFNTGNIFGKSENGSSIGKINFRESGMGFYKNSNDISGQFISSSFLLYKTNSIFANIDAAFLTTSRTYTLPNQSGTFALDENVVHKTGDETIDGNKTFNAGNIFIKSSNSATIGKINFQLNRMVFYKNPTDALGQFLNGGLRLHKTNDIYADISPSGLTSARTYTLPNESGTIVLDTTIGNTFVTLTGDQTISGVKTFTNNSFNFGNAIISAAGLTASRTFTLPNQAGSIALDANVVHMTGNENITGIKNFISDLIVNGITVGRGNSNTSVRIGLSALQNNTGGGNNVAIGYQAIFSATNSSSLVAVGSGALRMNSSGSANTAIGTEALTANTIGNSNTAIGRESLKANTIGFQNTGVGRSVMFLNVNGNNNSAFGNFALQNNIVGSGNTAIGANALQSTTGNNSVGIGINALQATTGGSNIGIGSSVTTLGVANTNSIVIGNGVQGLGSNTTSIGNSATTITGLYGYIRLISGMANPPATSAGTGVVGDIRVTAGFIYVCTATNTWVRTELTTW